MKKIITSLAAMAFVITTYAQRGQVHGSEWDGEESPSSSSFLELALIVGVIYLAYTIYTKRKKED